MAGVQNQIVKKGEVLLLQGNSSDHMYYLQNGTMEVLSASDEFNGLDKTILLKNSKRVAVVSESSFLAGFSGKTLRAVTECTVQKVLFPQNSLRQLAMSNPVHAITVLTHLFKRVETAYNDYTRVANLFNSLCRIYDNNLILLTELSGVNLPQRISADASDLHKRVASAQLPTTFDINFVIADKSDLLGKKYDMKGPDINDILNKDEYTFFKRFLRIDKNIFAHMIKADPEIPNYVYTKISASLNSILSLIQQNYEFLDHYMDKIFGDEDSLFEIFFKKEIVKDLLSSGRVNPAFVNQLGSVVSKLYATYSELTGENAAGIYPGLNLISKYAQIENSASASRTNAVSSSGPGESDEAILRLYQNSLHQIFKFAMAGEELQRNLLMHLGQFKKMENPFTAESDGRKIRRAITTLYWDLFSITYIRSRSEKHVPPPVRLMLKFGYIDENLVDPEQLVFLHKNSSMVERCTLPVLYEIEFLNRIFKKEIPPSINEMGLTYEKYLQEIAKSSSRKGPDPMDDLDDPVKMTMYEITNMLQSTTSVCSGSRSTSFPILTNAQVKGDLSAFLVTKTKIEEHFNELLTYDYSAFYRETVLKLGEVREVIEEEIKPYIIILPVFGTKIMMWQELSGTNKRSRARIVVPAFFMGDLFKSLAHAVAVFRWELTRSTKGGMWADPVEGGVTGAYVDYIQFYKKNSKLSQEAKEKINERFKSNRSNIRELFAEDYILWVCFERQGIMKMNGVARDLFYRYVPFPEELRNKLSNMPAFSESANRFKNIRARTIANFERKFKKYTVNDGKLPEPIQKYMEYLNM
ncbi:MAG: cyclic nucleotide-binding domain-containing protein [Spirochaetes bacterium]|nr:cyclic nucleotide-binding domain-containing protein [Spirochaetota bacterium]